MEAVRKAKVHKADDIPITALDPNFLDAISEVLTRNNEWSVMHSEDTLFVSVGESHFEGVLRHHHF